MFGIVFEAIRMAKSSLLSAKMRVESDDSQEAHIDLNKAQAKLRQGLLIEEKFLSQKARVRWLRHGDCNSKYFHSIVKQR